MITREASQAAREDHPQCVAGALITYGEEPILHEGGILRDGPWKPIKIRFKPHGFRRLPAINEMLVGAAELAQFPVLAGPQFGQELRDEMVAARLLGYVPQR